MYDQKVKEILIEVDLINSGLKSLKDSGRKVDELVDLLNRAKDERV